MDFEVRRACNAARLFLYYGYASLQAWTRPRGQVNAQVSEPTMNEVVSVKLDGLSGFITYTKQGDE